MYCVASIYLLAAVAIAAVQPAHAELISRDWLVPDDGLLTYDSVHGREWLDVTQTFLQPFGNTIDSAVAAAKPELEPGGTFEGFTLAGRQEVLELVEASGFVGTFPESLATSDRMRSLLNLLDVRGEEILGENGGPILDDQGATFYGVIDEVVPILADGNTANTMASLLVTPGGAASVTFLNGTGEPRVPAQSFVNIGGLMLYRIAVPEPASLPVCLAVLLATITASRSAIRL